MLKTRQHEHAGDYSAAAQQLEEAMQQDAVENEADVSMEQDATENGVGDVAKDEDDDVEMSGSSPWAPNNRRSGC